MDVSRKYMKKFSTYVPSALLYNMESKVHGQNFIRHFLALFFHVFKARSLFIISRTIRTE